LPIDRYGSGAYSLGMAKNGKAKSTKKLVQALVDPDDFDKIKQLAEKEERSVSFIVVRAIREYLTAARM
jgi:hypothetical protein